VDVIAGLLDGPRARRAFLLRCTMDPPWALRVEDEAPLSVVAMLRGRACFAVDGKPPQWLGAGDVALLRGPDHYLFADNPATPPQAIIHPGQRCTTPDGQDVPQMRSFGVRRWGNASDGATEILTGTYNLGSEVSRRLLDALPPQLVLRGDEWQTPVLGLLADEIPRGDVGQDAVLDRLLDLLLIHAVRAYFARRASQAPGWFRAQDDPIVGHAVRLLQDNPAEAWTLASLARETRVSRATLAPALHQGRRPAADGVPHRVAPDAGRGSHPRSSRDTRIGRRQGRLRIRVRTQRRLQACPRHQARLLPQCRKTPRPIRLAL